MENFASQYLRKRMKKEKAFDQEKKLFETSSHKYELTPQYAEYLRELVKKASAFDPYCKVFGSSKHKYQLNPVISLEEVQAYEQRHKIKLPSEYVFFITQVGNGGAGPYYGIYPLDTTKECYEIAGTPFISSKLTAQQWKEKWEPFEQKCNEESEDEDDLDNLYDRTEKETQQGTYAVGTQGCTYETLAIAQGEEENQIFYVNSSWHSEYMPYNTEMSFLEWYENFFLEIIQGNNVDGYGYEIIASQEELIARFNQSDDIKRKSKLLNSFVRFPKISKNTRKFLHQLSNELFADEKLFLLLKFDTEQGMKLFYQLTKENPSAAIRQVNAVPEQERGKIYDVLLNLLYTIENGDEKCSYYSSLYGRLLYTLKECPQLKSEDILKFLKNKSLNEQDIDVAIYVLGYAPDKEKAVDTFEYFMLNGTEHQIITSLQAVRNMPCPALKETFLTLWNRHRENNNIRNNLKNVFKTNNMEIPK